MSMARKCNKCDKCFDPYKQEGFMCRFKNPFFQSSKDIQENTVFSYLLVGNDTPDSWVDLCPECSRKFEAFMCGEENDIQDMARCDFVNKVDKLVNVWNDKFSERLRKMGEELHG